MEKIKLRSAFAVILSVFSCAAVIAEGETFKVSFDTQGGSPALNPIEVSANEPLGDKLPNGLKIKKQGYDFDCWQTEDGTEFTDTDTVTQNLTLQAKWAALHTVTFHAKGGKFESGQEQTEEEVKNNTPVKNWPEDPKREEYVFQGWYYGDIGEKRPFNREEPIAGDTTVYAHWKSNLEITMDEKFNEMNQKIDSLGSRLERKLEAITADTNSFLLIGASAGILAWLILLVFSLLVLNKINKKIPALIQNRFDDLNEKQNTVQQALDNNKREISAKLERHAVIDTSRGSPAAQDNSAYKADIERLQRRIDDLKDENRTLGEENRGLREEKRVSSGIASGSLNPADAFNEWAAYPQTKLPSAFYYIEGDMKIRTKRMLNESSNPDSKWITNRGGNKKYLFPNPNSFNQMTASDLLYKVIGSPKAKGQNRIRVTKACEMTNDGWVDFPGELEIL